MNNKNVNDNINSYQRSMSIDNDYSSRSNRAVSVEPNLISGGNDMKYFYQQQNSLSNDNTTKPFTLSSETINHST
jgi:hypothetical protein